MSVHLITGYAGKAHIRSQDARSFNKAMFGDGQFVMEIGNQLKASMIDNNTIRILDGDILMQGGHIRVEGNNDMTITTGTAGMNRNDLIVMTYEKNADTGIETARLEVLQGEPTASNKAKDPLHVYGDLSQNAVKNQMPLYRVTVAGVVLSKLERFFTIIPTYKTLAAEYAEQFQNSCNEYLASAAEDIRYAKTLADSHQRLMDADAYTPPVEDDTYYSFWDNVAVNEAWNDNNRVSNLFFVEKAGIYQITMSFSLTDGKNPFNDIIQCQTRIGSGPGKEELGMVSNNMINPSSMSTVTQTLCVPIKERTDYYITGYIHSGHTGYSMTVYTKINLLMELV